MSLRTKEKEMQNMPVWLGFGRDALPAHELVAWLGARYRLRDVTFQEPEIEDVIRRIYEERLLLTEAI